MLRATQAPRSGWAPKERNPQYRQDATARKREDTTTQRHEDELLSTRAKSVKTQTASRELWITPAISEVPLYPVFHDR